MRADEFNQLKPGDAVRKIGENRHDASHTVIQRIEGIGLMCFFHGVATCPEEWTSPKGVPFAHLEIGDSVYHEDINFELTVLEVSPVIVANAVIVTEQNCHEYGFGNPSDDHDDEDCSD